MTIAGLQKTSLIDYPGKISAVIFTSGCNLSCPFCHNPELVNPKLSMFNIHESEIIEFLKKRKKILDGVVITGGEPTIYPDLIDFIKKIKKLNLLIKLDTNGTNPELIKKLIDEKLVDYVAMDIKGPLSKYPEIVAKDVDLQNIKKSVELIKKAPREYSGQAKIDYEFRTTVIPKYLDKKDFEKIGEWFKGAKNYYLQQYRNTKTLDPDFQHVYPYDESKLQEFAKIMKKYVKDIGIRGI